MTNMEFHALAQNLANKILAGDKRAANSLYGYIHNTEQKQCCGFKASEQYRATEFISLVQKYVFDGVFEKLVE